MSYDVIIKNARIPQGDNTVLTNILVKDEKIAGFINCIDGIEAKNIIDAEGNLTAPGFIDSHTHYMYQGFPHRENFLTGSAASARGGITTVVDMPCCSVPSARSVDQLKLKIDVCAPQAVIDYAMWGGVTGEDVREGWLHNVKEQADYGVVGFKVYMTPSVPTYPRVTDPEMLEIFKAVAKTGLPVGVHAENFAICDYYVKKFQEEGRMDAPAWSEARNELAEKVAIELGISFAEATGARYHVVHMSTGIGAKLVADAKRRGINVTAESCPHYLTLNYQDTLTKFGSFAKVAPPLRTSADIEEQWEGLRDGSIDFMATDHAPYEIESEKKKEGMNIWTAFPGFPGTETMAPIIISEGLNKGRLSLSRTIEVLSTSAAKQYGLYPKKGALEIGSDADFAIVDLDKEWVIDSKENQASMCGYTPLEGMKLKGRIVKTIVRGNIVFDDTQEGVLPSLTDEEMKTIVHNYPAGVEEDYADIFEQFPNLHSAEYDRSYRKEHPEKIDEDVRRIKGIMVKPGFGQLVKRQSIQELPKTLTYDVKAPTGINRRERESLPEFNK
ncbi:dihydroorotase PyrC [Gottschalkia acidurici 9a]|uniref:Dihydroorotase PyrC n=1 Tax=Gottschalkia acidurici (strain ATCC 7906 / DSM 604 / BCRC 14475 / CIP 104303 / KCTC 5404 / NCIMB 10678 / 9a) TaxID=1128398 RepID=K0AWA5_GOTA9|nr:dihydroorotase family protein [Gottschalkia acidurici]AFS77499.1 dihydroorotase PyrC [Gottschalkia acidurici 9a]